MPDIDLQPILDDIAAEMRPLLGQGKVADYIPALAAVPADRFGIAVAGVDGVDGAAGDADERFSIQSIAKVFTLELALRATGPALWKRVGREPSGNPFNSLVQLEYEHGIPRNPLINAGAIVALDALMTNCDDPAETILEHVRRAAAAPDIAFDETVAASEAEWGHRNRALASFLKSFGNLNHDVDAVLDVYFHICALAMSCRELARAFLHFANGGVDPRSGETFINPRRARRINALMMTCGLYDAVGDFAFHVGMPAKSGVGGGIAGVVPGRFAVCVWSPGLDASHSSLAGQKALEALNERTGCSVF